MSSIKRLLILSGLTMVVFASRSVDIKAHFPVSKNSTYPRLRMVGSLPVLREFTVCSWVKSYHLTTGCSAILSYASNRSDNEIVVSVCKGSSNLSIALWRVVNHTSISCDYTWKMNSWYHVCVSWFGYGDTATAFINGKKCQEVHFISEDVVQPGGVIVIGQDQDAFDAGYELNAAFSGDLADYHLWDEVLGESNVKELARCGRRRGEGNIISWMKTPMVPVDGVVISETKLCSP